MKYYKLNKQGVVIDKILSSFDGWDFLTYPKVVDRIANPPVMSQVALDGGLTGAVAWLTAYAEGDYEGWLKVRTTGNDGGIIFTADLNPGVETKYNNATKTFTLSGDNWSSYLKFPQNKGTSEEPAIIATLNDINSKANDSDVIHKGTSETAAPAETRYGNLTIKGSLTLNGTTDPMPLAINAQYSSNNNARISKGGGSGNIDILLGSGGRLIGNGDNYGYKLPLNYSLTADKTIATTEDIPVLHRISISEGHSGCRVITFLVMTKISDAITLTQLINTDIASRYFVDFSFGGIYNRNTAPYCGVLQITSASQSGMTYTVYPGEGTTLVESITWSEVQSWSSFTDHVLN